MIHPQTDMIGLNFRSYYFINTKSGNGVGQKLISLKNANLDHKLGQKIRVRQSFVDLYDEEDCNNQIENMKLEMKQKVALIRVIICGGDGTINWAINELYKNNVDLQQVYFGVLPIGTGNDFCRGLGWSVTFDFTIDNLTTQIKKWIEADLQKYDLWDVTIEVFDQGFIYNIKDKKQQVRPQKIIKKLFTNYVGLGLDARVVHTMQKYRTSYAFINRILYCLVGCFNLLSPMKQLKQNISFLTENHDNTSNNDSHNILEDTLDSSKNVVSELNRKMSFTFKKGYKGIVCLNCTSYMSGLRDVWKTRNIALDRKYDQESFTPQAHNDGKIEFVAFKSQLGLACQHLMRSGAKVSQGEGPFEIALTEPVKDEISYIQIDGESLKIVNLKSIKINRSNIAHGHQINVMVKLHQT